MLCNKDPNTRRMVCFRDMDRLVDDTFISGDYNWEHCFSGLVAEVGEVAEKYQKAFRANMAGPNAEDVAKELGDVLWYLTALAHWLDFDLYQIAIMNEAKLDSRQERGVIEGEGDDR